MKTIRTSAIAAAIALGTSAPPLAQTDRVYVTGVGGFAKHGHAVRRGRG